MALYHIRQIGLDGHDLTAMVDFWSAALGYELDHRESDYAILRDPADAEPRLFLQQVPEPKVGKNRAHMDVEVPDEGPDRKSTRLNSSHERRSRMPSSA